MKPLSIKEIRDYINRNYPDSDAVERYYNCSNKVLEEDAALREMFLDDCKDCFWSEELHWCGCGDTDKAATAIRDYLIACWRWIDLCNKPHPKKPIREYFDCDYVFEDRLLLCLAYAMDAAEFTEHGTSINGAWITDKGKVFLSILLLSNLED